jgi:hypothetical protein
MNAVDTIYTKFNSTAFTSTPTTATKPPIAQTTPTQDKLTLSSQAKKKPVNKVAWGAGIVASLAVLTGGLAIATGKWKPFAKGLVQNNPVASIIENGLSDSDLVQKVKASQEIIQKQINYRVAVRKLGKADSDLLEPLQGVETLAQAKHTVHGDLHASLIKNIEHLIGQGLLYIKNKDDYQKLLTLHQELSSNLNTAISETNEQSKIAKQLLALDTLIENALDTDPRLLKDKTVTYIGDELSDRGVWDMYNLKIWQKIHKKNPNVLKFVWSNHTLAGFSYLKKGKVTISPKQASSQIYPDLLKNDLEKLKPGIFKELNKLYDDHFKRMQLVAYDPDKNHLMMHAPMSPQIEAQWRRSLSGIMKETHGMNDAQLNQPASKWTKDQYKAFIDEMNKYTQYAILQTMNPDVKTLDDGIVKSVLNLVNTTVWNRHSGVSEFEKLSDVGLYHPSLYDYTHGHTDGNDIQTVIEKKLHIHNLDNQIRKGHESKPYGGSPAYPSRVLIVE